MQVTAMTTDLSSVYRALLIVVSLALLSAVCTAQDIPLVAEEEEELPTLRRYAVELIVFENGSGIVAGNEIFLPEELPEEFPGEFSDDLADEFGATATQPDATGLEPIDAGVATVAADTQEDSTGIDLASDPDEIFLDDIDLNTPIEEFLGYDSIRLSLIDPEEYTMTGLYERLKTLDAYEPVLHSGWIQATFEEQQTPVVRLRTLGTVPLRFDGTLTLFLSRYLHLVVDLSLEDQQLSRGGAAMTDGDDNYENSSWTGFGYEEQYDRRTGPVIYRLNENRIVADGDLRFFDHPKFGVLARISRLEDQLVEPEPEPGDLESEAIPAIPAITGD